MPLRPALLAFHPRGPEPKAVRKVSCPHCARSFEVSKRAMSVRCPGCTRPLQFSDLNLNSRVEGDVSTMGLVNLDDDGQMLGKLTCGELRSSGSFQGKALVYGLVELRNQSLTTGDLTARSLNVDQGATLRGTMNICPRPKVEPSARLIASRQVRRTPKRLTSATQSTFAPMT